MNRVLGTEADYDTEVPNSSTMGVLGVGISIAVRAFMGPMRVRALGARSMELGACGLTNVIVMPSDDMMVHKQTWDAENCSCDQGFKQRQRV